MRCVNIRVTPSTFTAAMEKTKATYAKGDDCEVTLSFAGGEYRLSEPVVLDASEYKGETRLRMIGGGRIKPIFTSLSSLPTEEFKPVDGKPYYVYQFTENADGSYPNLRSVYVNGEIADVSRTAEYRTCAPFQKGEVNYAPKQENFNDTHRLYIPVEAVNEAGIENCKGAELHIRVEWEFKIYHIDYIDMSDEYVDEKGNQFVAMQLCKDEKKDGNPVLTLCSRVFFICNTTSVLTTKGQFTYERAFGKLYYYPKKDIASCRFAIGVETNLFHFLNFDAVEMRGLTFTGLEDDILTKTGYYAAHQAGHWNGVFKEDFPHAGAVKIDNIEECDIDECVFTDIPCDAVSFVGVLRNIHIHDSRFTNIGAGAIRVGRPVLFDEKNKIENIRIENNFLYNIAFTYENCCAILLTKARDAVINHNTIIRTSYTGISVGWKWDKANWTYGEEVNLEHVEIAYNYICSFMTNMRDGGGIYTLGGNVEVHSHAAFINTLHDNYVIEDAITCPENGFFGTLYHDGASSNWHNYNNVVIHNPRLDAHSSRIYLQAAWAGAFIGSTAMQASWHILSENNYVCGCKNYGEIYRSQSFDPERATDMLDYTRDNRELNTHVLATPKDLERYPEALHIMKVSGCDEKIGKKTRVILGK